MTQRCAICSEDDVEAGHEESRKHQKNVLLEQLHKNKKHFTENRNGLTVLCTVYPTAYNADPLLVDCAQHVVKASIQPRTGVKFSFSIKNENEQEVILDGVTMLPSNIVNFKMTNDNLGLGRANETRIPPRSTFGETVNVLLEEAVIGKYEMPLFFFFRHEVGGETIDTIIIKDMAVFVETVRKSHEKVDSPYTGESVFADKIIPSTITRLDNDLYVIPSKDHKIIFSRDLKTEGEGVTDEQKALGKKIKAIFDNGVSQENYRDFWHNLLWYEETVISNNLKTYNMSKVNLQPRGKAGKSYALLVKGLAEKRPSLMIGDKAHVRPSGQTAVLFEAVITDIEDDFAVFAGLNREFVKYYNAQAQFDVHWFLSRLPLERMHAAAHAQPEHAAERAFPRTQPGKPVQPVTKFYNALIGKNPEQRAVVSHIVAGSSGTAPYLLYGPPGTGKTVTIVEAILQLAANPKNQILVCTDSNKAADHVATKLIQYRNEFPAEEQFILRANSEFRVWDFFPEELVPYSNGKSRGSWWPVSIHKFRSHRIVITTLIHAAKFAIALRKKRYSVQRVTTHVFVDEAAQASEPATLVPVVGLLAPGGQLVLAGDPMQLGPVVISPKASKIGLGMSLMERLKLNWPLYAEANPNYIMMLKKNFRNHADILRISDELFYKSQLEALAPFDALSETPILGDVNAKSRAIMFHGVLSKEQRMGKSPSFFNSMELESITEYILALVHDHSVDPKDIGVVTPYIRQVYKIKYWLLEEGLEGIEVGTVEGFQGMEKRVILISTVRANCDLFAYDAKFRLGFVVDPKRFNVALTRAKAKLIVVGNPLCLQKDRKWAIYIQRCREFGTYTGCDAGSVAAQEANETAMCTQLTPILQAMTRALASIKL